MNYFLCLLITLIPTLSFGLESFDTDFSHIYSLIFLCFVFITTILSSLRNFIMVINKNAYLNFKGAFFHNNIILLISGLLSAVYYFDITYYPIKDYSYLIMIGYLIFLIYIFYKDLKTGVDLSIFISFSIFATGFLLYLHFYNTFLMLKPLFYFGSLRVLMYFIVETFEFFFKGFGKENKKVIVKNDIKKDSIEKKEKTRKNYKKEHTITNLEQKKTYESKEDDLEYKYEEFDDDFDKELQKLLYDENIK